jgi:hypothetical protein
MPLLFALPVNNIMPLLKLSMMDLKLNPFTQGEKLIEDILQNRGYKVDIQFEVLQSSSGYCQAILDFKRPEDLLQFTLEYDNNLQNVLNDYHQNIRPN